MSEIIYYKCLCGREWTRKITKDVVFISPGVCICGGDHIKILSKLEVRQDKLKKLGI